MSYNSKYTGAQVEELLDLVANGEAGGGGAEEVYIGEEEPTNPSIELWVDESIETDDDGNILDSEMSDSSENAVQNKVIKAYVDTIVGDVNSILDNINGEVI
jgi:hypothetical protein